jgi:ATP-dependent exoDNAse (exonuclease V) beta subunit
MNDTGDLFAYDDATTRERALDVRASFIVQAPAGSGKTELLIQRFMALLATVDRPERVVAMTFTRKAAGEMRERIIAALRDANANAPIDSTHQARTRDLARAVLAQDRRQGWQLEAYPARLAIFTIDALAQSLVRQAPVTTRLGATPRYEEWAAPLYAEAARTALARAPADDSAWRRLMAHLDNDAKRAIELVAAMLAKRDQWLHFIGANDRAAFRAHLEATLAAEIVGEMSIAASLFPPKLRAELAMLERYAGSNLADSAKTAELATSLHACAAAGGLPESTVAMLHDWRSLVDWLLLSGKPRFRVQMRSPNGFPAAGRAGSAGFAVRERYIAAIRALLLKLGAIAGLADALHVVRSLPPERYPDATWSLIDALEDILPSAAAELAIVFSAAGAMDFTQGTLCALAALGDEDAPSDLLLKLDLKIFHLLIDEFQDTSFVQLDLIRRLTAGWQPGDGRTLFAVGDPMQSIYRFRGAEVRLFVEAQAAGRIGDVPVETLVLVRNFRAQRGLVAWVNRVFPSVMGMRSDPWRGTVAFTAAIAERDPLPGIAASLDIFADATSEARAVAGFVSSALASGADDAAVLVRARSHLSAILPALRAAGIAYAAVELDPLVERPVVQDLVSLTHALAQPADRLAWLSVLRAPWCGLLLADLLAIATAADARIDRSVAALIYAPDTVPGLTGDGRARLTRIAEVLAPALDARGRAGLEARVRGAWLALGGTASIDEELDLNAAERYWELLREHEVAGDIPDWSSFADAARELRSTAEPAGTVRVQVMTLHKAKGLEFDTVVMPGLAHPIRHRGQEILRWRRRPSGLLVAPMTARGRSDDTLYSYLKLVDDDEESAELARLLYVGATRAKRRLHLTSALRVDTKHPGGPRWSVPHTSSALAKFWPHVHDPFEPPIVGADVPASAPGPRLLRRVPSHWSVRRPDEGLSFHTSAARSREIVPFDWARETARHVGTVAHRLFAEMAGDGLDAWDDARLAKLQPRIRAELAVLGVDNIELAQAIDSVTSAASHLLKDKRGQWLFDSTHTEGASEWALAGIEGDSIIRVVVDRTFVADGVRWVVEFKTSTHEGAGLASFLDQERERYRPQLERYARFVRGFDARPIRLGLYHPLLRGWREWAFED